MAADLETGLPTSARAPASGYDVIIACVLVALAGLGVLWLAACDPLALDPRNPTFSVDIAGFDGLDGPEPAPTVNPAFNLTLHGVSPRHRIFSFGMCQERGTVAVSYAGAVLAWGRVPAFCVPAHGQRHVGMVALGADVGLSDELRGRLAAEWLSLTAELDVDIMLDRRLSRTAELDVDIMLDRQRYLSCRVELDELSSQPSPCKVYV